MKRIVEHKEFFWPHRLSKVSRLKNKKPVADVFILKPGTVRGSCSKILPHTLDHSRQSYKDCYVEICNNCKLHWQLPKAVTWSVWIHQREVFPTRNSKWSHNNLDKRKYLRPTHVKLKQETVVSYFILSWYCIILSCGFFVKGNTF